ncbi:MAG: hypothetical protein QXG01_01415 [Candidatus Bathyarchaeia archaeon]
MQFLKPHRPWDRPDQSASLVDAKLGLHYEGCEEPEPQRKL